MDTVALKKIMLDNGIDKIGQLSKAAGISRATLGTVLSGKTQPSSEVMRKLVIALSISPETAGAIFFAGDLRSR